MKYVAKIKFEICNKSSGHLSTHNEWSDSKTVFSDLNSTWSNYYLKTLTIYHLSS